MVFRRAKKLFAFTVSLAAAFAGHGEESKQGGRRHTQPAKALSQQSRRKHAAPLQTHSSTRFIRSVKYFGRTYFVHNHAELVSHLEQAAAEAGRATGVPASLIRALVPVESGGRPRARSRSNALGVTQLKRQAFKEVGKHFGYRVTDAFDIGQNMKAAGFYLRLLLAHHVPEASNHAASVRTSIAMYRLGPNNPASRNPPRRVRRYVNTVFSTYSSDPATASHAWVPKLIQAERQRHA